LELIGVSYERVGEFGDFGWMIEQPGYADALFIFNDNERQFLMHRREPHTGSGCYEGGGNAVIRPYQCQDPPRAAGIPTGASGRGYQVLDAHVRSIIDRAISDIKELLRTGSYDRVFYSSDGKGGLGTGIFDVGDVVRTYILEGLRDVTEANY
jgi:hypothetical protein